MVATHDEGGVDWRRLASDRNVPPAVARGLWERARATAPHDPKQAETAFKHLLEEAAAGGATHEPGRGTLVDAKGPHDPASLGPGKVTRVLEEQKPQGPSGSAKPAGPAAAAAGHSPEALRRDLVGAVQAGKNAVEVLKSSDPATIVEALRELKAQDGPAVLQKIMSAAGSVIERILGKHLPEPHEQPAVTTAPATMRVTASALHVRSTPDKKRDDNIIGLLPHHTIVHTTHRAGEWVGIDHGGKPAFVYAQYVEDASHPVAESKSKPGPTKGAPPAHEHKDAPADHGPAAPASTVPSATPAPVTPHTPVATPSPVATPAPAPAVTPAPVASGGPIAAAAPTVAAAPHASAAPTASSGPLDALRASVAMKSPEESLAAYHKLNATGRTQLRAEVTLVSDLVAVLDVPHALSVLDELKLDRPTTLQVAARARGADAAFLGQVLHHLHVDSIGAMTAAAGDLVANSAYLPLLDQIINAKGVTAKQQLALAMSSGGLALVEKIRPGLGPLAALPALAADQAAQRAGYLADPAFGNWLFSDPASLHAEIKRGTGGADWGRLLLAGRHQLILIGWVATDQAFWGNVFGTALLKPDGNEVAALRSLRLLAGVIFRAIAQAQSIEGLLHVFAALKFTLPEQINALGDAGRLDAKSLQLMLDGPQVGPAEQATVAADDEATARIRVLSSGKRPSQVFTKLASDPALFCAAVGHVGTFSKWVTEKVDVLAQEMMTVISWDAWMKAFQKVNDPMLFLSVAAVPELQHPLRGALMGGGWSWLLQSAPHPIPTQAQVDVIFKLYGDGTGVALADKYALWAALYTTPLKRRGDDVTMTWTNTAPTPETGVVRWFAVDPNDTAMNLFFRQYGQMPRMHIDTATAVIMCNVFTVQKTRDVEGPGGVKTKTTAFYQDTPTNKDNVIPAPGEIAMTTSFYGYNNTLFMRATDGAGSADVSINGDDFIGKAGQAPGAVNRSKPGLAAPDMSYFQNHATHEVGHAVAERVLKRGKYEIKGNDFVKQYGQWKDGGSGLDYAHMLGFSAALEGKHFEVRDLKPVVPRTLTYTGLEIRDFLIGIVQGGLASQSASKIATELGSPQNAFDAVMKIGDVAGTVMVKTINTNLKDFPGAGWQFPHGINGEANTVTMFADGKWQQYHASIFNHRVSSYSTYSSGENFAEMYTSKYTSGVVPPAIGGNSIADFFNELTNADPSELGLAPPAPGAAAPGAADRASS